MPGTSRAPVRLQRSRQPACFPLSLPPTCMAAVTCSNASQGLFRELNPGPPAPEAGIIPLDQQPVVYFFFCMYTKRTAPAKYVPVVIQRTLGLVSKRNGKTVTLNPAILTVLRHWEFDTSPQQVTATLQTCEPTCTHENRTTTVPSRQQIEVQPVNATRGEQIWRNMTDSDFAYNERLDFLTHYTTSTGVNPGAANRPFMNVAWRLTCATL